MEQHDKFREIFFTKNKGRRERAQKRKNTQVIMQKGIKKMIYHNIVLHYINTTESKKEAERKTKNISCLIKGLA